MPARTALDKNALWKWLILALLVVVSLASIMPIGDKLVFGLDIAGGLSVQVEVDREFTLRKLKADPERAQDWRDLPPEREQEALDKYLGDTQDRLVEVLRNRVDNSGLSEPIIYPEGTDRVVVQIPGIKESEQRAVLEQIKRAAYLSFRLVHQENAALVKELFDAGDAPPGYGIASDSGGRNLYRQIPDAIPSGDRERFEKYKKRLRRFHAPALHDFMVYQVRHQQGTYFAPAFVSRKEELSGKYLKNAAIDYQQGGMPIVTLEFNSEGRDRFGIVTGDYAPKGARNPDPENGRRLAIILDGTLYSAPELRVPIYTGRAIIEGIYDIKEARKLVNALRAGSLPAPVRIVRQESVSPSLGQDAVDSGFKAIKIGAVVVLVFMLAYYMLSGIVANIALILNIILLPLGAILAGGFLGIFARNAGPGAAIALPVLTLPGMAGILLTIGIAVDANVLIFERVREEFSTGKPFWTAITSGYQRAFLTIFDANVTTLLTGIILYIFGSGPIRGFAVLLCAGIIVSMYTALIVTRMIFHALANLTNLQGLKMMSIVGKTTINFLGFRRSAAILSVSVLVVGWGIMITRGIQNPGNIFGVDLTGGSSLTFSLQDSGLKPEIEDIRFALGGAGLNDVQIQYQSGIGLEAQDFLVIRTAKGESHADAAATLAADTMRQAFPQVGFSVEREEDIGPQIGSEMKRRAVKAIIIALICIVIYITIRFEFGFAIGAIAALVHDVLITLALYSLCGREIGLHVVAALLTIVGYSVNDTIVVFDRIREDLRIVRDRDFAGICNQSINRTLSRTLLTSFTTLLAVTIMLVFGGGAIFDFALTLCIGVVAGTYSSIFIATPTVLAYHRGKKPELGAVIAKPAA